MSLSDDEESSSAGERVPAAATTWGELHWQTARSAGATSSSASLEDKLRTIGRNVDRQVQRDLATVMLELGWNVRAFVRFVCVVVFITAVCHGAFIVLLALKLDGNSILNWYAVPLRQGCCADAVCTHTPRPKGT